MDWGKYCIDRAGKDRRVSPIRIGANIVLTGHGVSPIRTGVNNGFSGHIKGWEVFR